jgi:hypothetical protein
MRFSPESFRAAAALPVAVSLILAAVPSNFCAKVGASVSPRLSGYFSTTPAWVGRPPSGVGWYGDDVASAGDVNGDGYDDVLVGGWASSGIYNSSGRAVLYLGSVDGISQTPAWDREGDTAGEFFGAALAPVGDVNGDGYGDVIVGSPFYSNGETQEGRVYLFLGTPEGFLQEPAWTFESDVAGSRFGSAVACAGDVNADGYNDIVVGAYLYDRGDGYEGAAYVFLGTAEGFSATPTKILFGNKPYALFGESVAGAGDVNNDGYDDVIVGASNYLAGPDREGAVFLYLGSPDGVGDDPDWTYESRSYREFLGSSLAGAGDVDGDGYDDIIVGASEHTGTRLYAGAAYLFRGIPSGLSSTPVLLESDQEDTDFGISVAGVGDVNGDGFSDVLIGADSYYSEEAGPGGAAFLYLGSPVGLKKEWAWRGSSGKDSAWYGCSVAGAGDVNGDGLADWLVGAYNYDCDSTISGAAFAYRGKRVSLFPVLSRIGAKTATEGKILKFSVSAADPNGDDLTLSANPLPAGATFSNGTFTWLPQVGQAGRHSVTFAANDGQYSDAETVVITVKQQASASPPSVEPDPVGGGNKGGSDNTFWLSGGLCFIQSLLN